MVGENPPENPRPRRGDRQIGRLGTASRVIGGVAAVAIPLIVWGATWWDWVAAMVGLPLLATAVTAAVARIDARSRRAEGPPQGQMSWGAALLVVLTVLAVGTAATFVTPVDGTGIWIFVGTSMLVAAVKGYGGCEVLAFANLINGRQDRVGCVLFAPIDAAEATAAGTGRRGT